ncbi:MAG: HAMP domain-containing sensor histidine kinase [Deltaproteobacteria bacterium]|nr:HAMP domain-containing sensor histidine kinase [Deltaproteobacteria bacterium]
MTEILDSQRTLPSSVQEQGEATLPRRVALAGALGLALVAAISVPVGIRLVSAREHAESTRRAQTIARTMAARIAVTDTALRSTLMARATARSGALVAIVQPDGTPLRETVLFAVFPPSLSAHRASVATLESGDRRMIAASAPVWLEGRPFTVIAAVPENTKASSSIGLELATLLAALATLGLAAAVLVARDVTNDLRAITRRARSMANASAHAVSPLPVHARDETGALVQAFNRLQSEIIDQIEEHRVALLKLEDAERRKETQIATLRHELRTPLNSIIGFADLLLSGVDGPLSEAQNEDVEAIARSGRHLLHLVDDVLDLSSIASGHFVVAKTAVDLAAITHEVLLEARGPAKVRRVQLVGPSTVPVVVEGDATSLRRAITNLVHNALQHCRSRVTLELHTDDQRVKLHVRDDGGGIQASELKRLFKPFESGREGGAGLGLAITVALLELHGGTLRAESVPGSGSTFTATIPLHPTALSQAGFA